VGEAVEGGVHVPGTKRTTGNEIIVTWYDGKDHKPKHEGWGLPAMMEVDEEDKKTKKKSKKKGKYELPGAGSAFVGEKGTMILPHWDVPQLYPAEKFKTYAMPKLEDINHYTSWAHACLGDGNTTSNFDYAGRCRKRFCWALSPSASRRSNSCGTVRRSNSRIMRMQRRGW